MFQYTALASYTYGLGARSFGNLGINACLTASPSFSQPTTPFIAFTSDLAPRHFTTQSVYGFGNRWSVVAATDETR
jgi:hypothetical protein